MQHSKKDITRRGVTWITYLNYQDFR